MRILSVAFPEVSVGTRYSGGSEHILSIIDRGLVQRGHHSAVVASKGSNVAGTLVAPLSPTWQAYQNTIESVLENCAVDLVHFHGLDFNRYLPRTVTPMLATLHLPLAFYPEKIFEELTGLNLTMNCVSKSQASAAPEFCSFSVIPNGIPVKQYSVAKSEDFLLWLGRICPEKGVHIALKVAHEANAALIVAGPVHPYPAHQQYFIERVKPLLDNNRIYVGPVHLSSKRWLLAHAKCLLVPSLVPETSSLVSMEALSSGTPIIAFRSGALPEIVEDNVTGFIVNSAEHMSCAIHQINRLSREICRREALRRFDSERMVEDYIHLYREITTRHLGMICAPQESLYASSPRRKFQ